MSTELGPDFWDQPLFGGNGVPRVIVGRSPLTPTGGMVVEEIGSYDADLAEEQGVTVQASSGRRIPHARLESPSDPLSLEGWEIELELKQVSPDPRRFLLFDAPSLASSHDVEVWLDRSIADVWLGDGARTTFLLSRRTAYGSTTVSFLQRPAKCFVDNVELSMVTSGPGPGECLLPQASDATQIVLGTTPAATAVVTFSYYPVLTPSAVSASESKTEANDADLDLSFTEYPPVRA